MTDLLGAFQYFHFLRPWWLALIPVVLLLWWRMRAQATTRQAPTEGLAAHLAAALTVGGVGMRPVVVADGVGAIMILISLAVAGPSWSRVPNPLVAQTAPLAVALEVSDSMLQTDVPPSRIERAKHKILDVIAGRAGGRTALIAYAGSAHGVVPLTEDPEVLKPFVEGLSPEVMPSKGQNATAALELARAALAAEDTPGAILFVLDDLDRADLSGFEDGAAKPGPRVLFLSIGGSESALDELARVPGAAVVRATADRSDVAEIERRVASAYRDALARDERQKWDDRGWMLVWPAALLLAFWFRRGWAMRWILVLGAALSSTAGGPAHADGIVDWFLTPDQQGRLAYEDKAFGEAGELFEDPMWKGTALYRAGKYLDAAAVFARLPTAEAAVGQGLAYLKGREYRKGITAFETALEREPDHAAAARNLEIANAILAYLERVREQSGTEEGSEGADEVVFDKEAKGGTDTVITGATKMKMESAAQWMRTVDTRTADFLRIRFALEAAKAGP
jgi:Ca-activated chloride channel family protein